MKSEPGGSRQFISLNLTTAITAKAISNWVPSYNINVKKSEACDRYVLKYMHTYKYSKKYKLTLNNPICQINNQ